MRPVRLLCFLFLALSPGGVAIAQNLGTGLYSFGSFDSRGFDTVNLGNLNTHFEIPIVSKPGRGMNFSYSIVYDGLIWSAVTSNGVQSWVPDSGFGFHEELLGNGQIGYVSYTETQTSACPPIPPNKPGFGTIDDYSYHDAFGRVHLLNYTVTACVDHGTTVTGSWSSSDGSGYSFDGTHVHTRNGAIINAPINPASQTNTGSITDSNGNTITNNGNGTFTDTLGKTELTITGTGSASSPLSLSYPVTLQSDNSPVAAATIYYKTYTVQTNFGCAVTDYGARSVDLVDHITLADGVTIYSFTYETTPGFGGSVTGRLASITLPTGGAINYSYTGGCNGTSGINPDGTVGVLTRTTSDGTRTYGRGSINNNATFTTLQDEKNNASVYQFTETSGLFYETHRQLYQGASSGTLLMEQTTCYNGASSSCDGALINLPITQTYTQSSYNGGTQLTTANVYDGAGMLTSSTQSSGGTTLMSVGNSYNTLEELTASGTLDSSGNTVAYSYYGYDEIAPTATSGIPQHSAVSGARGNQTSAHVSGGASYLTTTTAYYDTGVPVSTTTPSGTTSYGYDSTQTFATTTTLPTPSSGVQLSMSANYDQQSGALTSTTGLNGEQTQVTQYDRLLRPTVLILPNGSQVNYTYWNPNQTGAGQSIGNGQVTDTETILDAYGRTSRIDVYNGQSGNAYYETDYCYDATGLLRFQSARYQGNAGGPQQCSGNGTSYAYDALGRVTSITNADGTATRQYNGHAVKTTDVNGVQKITQYDVLGRTSSICEISSNSTMSGSGAPGNCGTDIGGTGFLTNYSYNLTTHTTTITQGAQTRSYTTDPAGRTTSVTEPERGTTNYSYAYNGTGLAVTRSRPQANQTNPAVTTTTTTQYDSLGRPVTVAYSDGITPGKYFYYDNNPFQSWASQLVTNLKGNLAVTATSASALLTSALFSYDVMGHVTTMWQCAPSICNTSSQASRPALTFSYDLVGNLTSEFDGASGNIIYGRSQAGEVTSITNQSYTDQYNTPNLVSNVVNGPNGPLGYTLGNGLYSTITYDSMGRMNGKWVCAGTPTGLGQPYCTTTQIYGYDLGRSGNRITNDCDTVNNQCVSYGYDEFNRLTSQSGPQNFSYSYDRYGNRWQQSAPQGGPAPTYNFNSSNNQIIGLGYDAAGNLTNDGFHSYTYDAEGNVLKVDGGGTAQYVYDAMNRRVSVQASGSTTEYLFDYAGRRISSWRTADNAGIQGRIYWEGQQIAYRA